MRTFYLFLIIMGLTSAKLLAQTLPHKMTEQEKKLMPVYRKNIISKGETTPPDFPVRSAAEWEEMQGIAISWQGYTDVLTEIVRHGVNQGQVYIVTQYQTSVENTLSSEGISLDSVVFVNEPSNSVWIRDYGPNNVYKNNVDSLIFVDWIYNRPRPDDDVIPAALAELLDVPLYEATQSPYDIEGTGGNFMSDGFGMGFSSELILNENPGHSEAEIEEIFQEFMGIDEYVLMETLPYDGIHHIDMHMKLLDEETLLVGEYPEGVADGPQIEENLQYILDNYQTVYGTPFKVIRIPMPPDSDGTYPDEYGEYRTYTNSLIFNKLILVPIYGADSDEAALDIYREAMPGYEVVGIDSDYIIAASGSIHCVTHELASPNPLLISHQPLTTQSATNLNHEITAYLEHREGIEQAAIMYRTDSTAAFSQEPMWQDQDSATLWHGQIPANEEKDSTQIQYYILADATSGKSQVRPMTAPEGFYSYKTGDDVNVPPVANAGPDQTADAQALVELDGTGSYDNDGDSLSYNWYTDAAINFDDAASPQPTFTAPAPENDTTLKIFLEVSDFQETSEPDTVAITINSGNAIAETQAGREWKIFPNPATSSVYLAFDNDMPELVRIVNTNGSVVLSDVPAKNYHVFKVNISNLQSGLYLVQAVFEDNVSTKRVVVK